MGCEYCRVTPANRDGLRFEYVRWLFARSHEHFRLARCPRCGQFYLEQFHEIVDWSGTAGDDLCTYWTPLTGEEVAQVDRAFPAEETASHAGQRTPRGRLPVLDDLMHRRERLVWHPDGQFYWSEFPYAAGDLLPPG